MNRNTKDKKKLDYLMPLLEKAPASWAIIRANEIRALETVEFVHPVLDVGCGDGLVAKVINAGRKRKFDWGIDIYDREVEKARKSGGYKHCKVASVYNLPFKDGEFGSVFSNSVIEHIADLDKALSEMSRVLRSDGKFIITVPSKYIGNYLILNRLFHKVGLGLIGEGYAWLFNKAFKHHNLYSDSEWRKILANHSLMLSEYKYYHSPKLIGVHEFLSYLTLPFHILKFFTGRWVIFPGFRKNVVLPLVAPILNEYYIKDTVKKKGGSLLLIAVKK